MWKLGVGRFENRPTYSRIFKKCGREVRTATNPSSARHSVLRDDVAKTGTLPFNPGDTTKTIRLSNGDSKREGGLTFFGSIVRQQHNSLFTKNANWHSLNDDLAEAWAAFSRSRPSADCRRFFFSAHSIRMYEVTSYSSAIEQMRSHACGENCCPGLYSWRKLGPSICPRKSGPDSPGNRSSSRAYVRLVDSEKPQHWTAGHFFAAAAESMRRS